MLRKVWCACVYVCGPLLVVGCAERRQCGIVWEMVRYRGRTRRLGDGHRFENECLTFERGTIHSWRQIWFALMGDLRIHASG